MAATSLATLGFGREPFSPEHEAFRETARRFFTREVEPNVKEWEKAGFYPAELFKTAAKYGLLSPGIPTEYGGGGGDVLHHVILHEEHGYSPAGASMEAGLTTDATTYLLLDGGTEEQKREWLPFFAAGNGIAEVGLTEAHAGSDASAIKTFARRDGDNYIINGSKMWMSNGPILTVLFAVAKTDLDGGKQGMSVFIVPLRGTKGVTIGKATPLMLKSCSGVSEVFFDNVRVPARNLIGGVEGKGLKHALSGIGLGRMGIAARCVAASELALHLTLQYTRERKAFGQRVIDFQNSQFKLATVKADIAAGRQLVDAYLRKLLAGNLSAEESAIAKLFTSETEGRAMDECLQLYGGMGYSDDMPISRMYAFARVHRIFAGTSEILRTVIARGL